LDASEVPLLRENGLLIRFDIIFKRERMELLNEFISLVDSKPLDLISPLVELHELAERTVVAEEAEATSVV